MQTVWILIRRRALQRLIWVYTVCQFPSYGTLGLNGLKHISNSSIYCKLLFIPLFCFRGHFGNYLYMPLNPFAVLYKKLCVVVVAFLWHFSTQSFELAQ